MWSRILWSLQGARIDGVGGERAKAGERAEYASQAIMATLSDARIFFTFGGLRLLGVDLIVCIVPTAWLMTLICSETSSQIAALSLPSSGTDCRTVLDMSPRHLSGGHTEELSTRMICQSIRGPHSSRVTFSSRR